MAHEAFIERDFRPSSLLIIQQANEIIADYIEQGFKLTLRQLYYQFVARDLLPNRQQCYDRLGAIISDARLAGLVDWDAIEDRTRNVRPPNVWESPQSIVDAVAEQYKEDLWVGQGVRVEVWIEKDALLGVVEPACLRWRVPYFACRGYSSQSEQYAAGQRFGQHIADGLRPIVLHLGDHDPSGIDMTRDNHDRLSMFASDNVEVRRLALNFDQVERFKPPPNPAKDTDSRAGKRLEGGGFTPGSYRDRYGESSWELDALDPPTIDALIDGEIRSLLDHDLWAERKAEEDTNRATLLAVSERWEEVKDFCQDGPA